MNDQDRQQFLKVLAVTLDAYGRRPPMADTVEMWFAVLRAFPIDQVRMACQQYVMHNPKDPPAPGAIYQLLQGKDSSRPGPEEAWSFAVRACDESDTVMLTNEIAQAWGVAQPIFNLGDEVGARMAFKEAYARIVSDAKAPAKWWPSIGHDPHKRDIALAEARRAGLLPAPQAAAILPPPAPTRGNSNPDGLKRIKALVADLNLKSAEKIANAQAQQDEARKAEQQRKADIAARVAKYQKGEE